MTTAPHTPLANLNHLLGMGTNEDEPPVVGSLFGVTMVVMKMYKS